MKTNLVMSEKITIDKSFLEHLIGCLANQKYINEYAAKDKIDIQKVIDKAYIKATEILYSTDD